VRRLSSEQKDLVQLSDSITAVVVADNQASVCSLLISSKFRADVVPLQFGSVFLEKKGADCSGKSYIVCFRLSIH